PVLLARRGPRSADAGAQREGGADMTTAVTPPPPPVAEPIAVKSSEMPAGNSIETQPRVVATVAPSVDPAATALDARAGGRVRRQPPPKERPAAAAPPPAPAAEPRPAPSLGTNGAPIVE